MKQLQWWNILSIRKDQSREADTEMEQESVMTTKLNELDREIELGEYKNKSI